MTFIIHELLLDIRPTTMKHDYVHLLRDLLIAAEHSDRHNPQKVVALVEQTEMPDLLIQEAIDLYRVEVNNE